MRFDLDEDQEAISGAVRALLARHGGPERARELGGEAPGYDDVLHEALAEGGFLDLARSPDAGPLEAALVVEAVARGAGVVPVGARALVATALWPAPQEGYPEGPVALTREGHEGPVRFAPHARTLVVVGDRGVTLARVDRGCVEPFDARYGYPMGRVADCPPIAELPGAEPASRATAWWRVALAVELVGTMQAALELTVDHVRTRMQFGRPIGSFQAVQHRLAELAVAVEGSRWLGLEAAWRGAPEEAAAVAATHACAAARRLFSEVHQLSGAIGLTSEYDLHLWTMRLPALWLEAEWLGPPAQAVSRARWAEELV